MRAFIVVFLVCLALVTVHAGDWDRLTVTWSKFDKLPTTKANAEFRHWTLNNVCAENACSCAEQPWVGYRYQDGSDVGSWPIYGADGRLAGLQAAVTASPTASQIPPWVKVGDLWLLTVYFRSDQNSICSSGSSSGSNAIGDSVYIMVDGKKVEFPVNETAVTSPWVKGKCFYTMGRHYWKGISANMNCDSFYPIFLLYNGGKLNGYGYTFLGDQSSFRWEHPGGSSLKLFFTTETFPQCLLNQEKLSTQHVYFTSPYLNFC